MINYQDIERIHLELSSYCNSSCPTCPRNVDGGIIGSWFSPNSLSLEDIKKILPSDFIKQLQSMNICGNYGDPMMCKDVYDIVSYIKEHNNTLSLNIHTNGGMRDKDFWFRLGTLNSDMPNLNVVFSIDGLSDTNHLYRIGVKWEKLIENVTSFISGGGKAVWDFLLFKHNEHQIEDARKLSQDLGFVKFLTVSPHGFKYNGKMRVVDADGKFVRHIEQSTLGKKSYESRFKNINFDISQDSVDKDYMNFKESVYNKSSHLYERQIERFSENDSVVVQNCMTKHDKEIYIDSNGSVHPCCYLGHINQDTLPIAELVYHKKWIDDTVGLENINARNKSIKDIIESYFFLIEESWSKTFKTGRNPMCAFKCGVEIPNGMIGRIYE